MCSQLLRLTSFKLTRFWSKMKSTVRNYTCIPHLISKKELCMHRFILEYLVSSPQLLNLARW
jgi:hypothetical protein